VTHQLAEAPESEVRAIADYFAPSMAKSPNAQDAGVALDKRESAGRPHPEGATLFAGACAACHEAGAPMMQQGRPPLAWGTPLQEGTPHDTLHVIVSGVAPTGGRAGPAMPAFGDDFTDRQLAEIAAYLRARYTDLQPWQNVEQVVADVRREAGR
jgi:mono/diheme cytochrome c family protein